MYGGGEIFFLNSPIKQEPGGQMDSQGLGMPIPNKRGGGRSGISEFDYDLGDEVLALGALPSLGSLNHNTTQTSESSLFLLPQVLKPIPPLLFT
jgi:hypothetical protein